MIIKCNYNNSIFTITAPVVPDRIIHDGIMYEVDVSTWNDDEEFMECDVSYYRRLNYDGIDVIQECKDLIADGKILAAVKTYKEATNCGLKEAKEFIDSLR